MSENAAREFLVGLFRAGIAAARGDDVLTAGSRVVADRWVCDAAGAEIRVRLPRKGHGRILVVGAGKAAASLARGLERVLDDRIDRGLVIVKDGHGIDLQQIRVVEGSHPAPDDRSVAHTAALLRMLNTTSAEDVVFCVLTGGASSLLVAPATGLSLEEKARACELLVNSGATIAQINTVRKHLSAVKGGRLRLKAPAATLCTLAISDVIGDDRATIGSGPTVPDPSTYGDALRIIERLGIGHRLPSPAVRLLQRGAAGLEAETPKAGRLWNDRDSPYQIVASNRVAVDACARAAREAGCEVVVIAEPMEGHTHEAARVFSDHLCDLARRRAPSAAPVVVLWGGETTLPVRGSGRGGRNQEFALVTALELQETPDVTVLAAGTDGTDGPTDAAGAFADAQLLARASARGYDVRAQLERNDAYPLLAATDDLFRCGPTQTNVMDVALAVIGKMQLSANT